MSTTHTENVVRRGTWPLDHYIWYGHTRTALPCKRYLDGRRSVRQLDGRRESRNPQFDSLWPIYVYIPPLNTLSVCQSLNGPFSFSN